MILRQESKKVTEMNEIDCRAVLVAALEKAREAAHNAPREGPDFGRSVTATFARAADEYGAALRSLRDFDARLKTYPVQDAEPMIGADEGQGSPIGRTVGANPATGARTVSLSTARRELAPGRLMDVVASVAGRSQ